MRCADLGPTPGSARSASTSADKAEGCFMRNRRRRNGYGVTVWRRSDHTANRQAGATLESVTPGCRAALQEASAIDRPLPAATYPAGCLIDENDQNGSLNPGGSGRPEVIPPIFSCAVASALRTASLNAAATRSSSMSLSQASRLASIDTRRTSFLQVIVTLTRPAPDCPSTSISASCSCIFFMFSCICWACFISPASWPFIMDMLLLDSYG